MISRNDWMLFVLLFMLCTWIGASHAQPGPSGGQDCTAVKTAFTDSAAAADCSRGMACSVAAAATTSVVADLAVEASAVAGSGDSGVETPAGHHRRYDDD